MYNFFDKWGSLKFFDIDLTDRAQGARKHARHCGKMVVFQLRHKRNIGKWNQISLQSAKSVVENSTSFSLPEKKACSSEESCILFVILYRKFRDMDHKTNAIICQSSIRQYLPRVNLDC